MIDPPRTRPLPSVLQTPDFHLRGHVVLGGGVQEGCLSTWTDAPVHYGYSGPGAAEGHVTFSDLRFAYPSQPDSPVLQ
ncbi:unnamed protein product, partial [Gadus morhua 'NCC']